MSSSLNNSFSSVEKDMNMSIVELREKEVLQMEHPFVLECKKDEDLMCQCVICERRPFENWLYMPSHFIAKEICNALASMETYGDSYEESQTNLLKIKEAIRMMEFKIDVEHGKVPLIDDTKDNR
jgi:hypothetical protein